MVDFKGKFVIALCTTLIGGGIVLPLLGTLTISDSEVVSSTQDVRLTEDKAGTFKDTQNMQASQEITDTLRVERERKYINSELKITGVTLNNPVGVTSDTTVDLSEASGVLLSNLVRLDLTENKKLTNKMYLSLSNVVNKYGADIQHVLEYIALANPDLTLGVEASPNGSKLGVSKLNYKFKNNLNVSDEDIQKMANPSNAEFTDLEYLMQFYNKCKNEIGVPDAEIVDYLLVHYKGE